MSNALPTSVLVLLSSSLRSFALRGEAFLVRTRCCLLCARLTTYCTRTYLLFLSLSLSFFLSSFFARSYLRNVVDAHASLAVINAIIISTKRSYRPAVFSSSTVVFLVPICAAIELCHSREDPPLSRVSQFLSLSLSREKKRRTKLSRGIIISLPSFLHSDLVFRRMEGRRRERIHHVAKRRRRGRLLRVHTPRVHWPPIRGSIARSSIIPYLPRRFPPAEVSRRPEHRFFDHIKIHFHAAAHRDSTTASAAVLPTVLPASRGHALLAMKSIPRCCALAFSVAHDRPEMRSRIPFPTSYLGTKKGGREGVRIE